MIPFAPPPAPKFEPTIPPKEPTTPLAHRALNFSSNGECLTKDVAKAIVTAINTDADAQTIATIFKNAVNYNYQNQLFDLIKKECSDFSLKKYSNLSKLNSALEEENIALSQVEDGAFLITQTPSTDFFDQELLETTSEALLTLSFPRVLSKIICTKSAVPAFKFDDKSLNEYAGKFTADGEESFKREFIKQAVRQGQKTYLNKVLTQARTVAKSGERIGVPNLTSVDLSGLDLSEVDLQMSTLKGANLKGTNLKNAKLDWAQITSTRVCGEQLDDAVLRYTIFTDSVLTGVFNCNLSRANLRSVTLTHANLVNAQLLRYSDSDKSELAFEGSTLTNVRFAGNTERYDFDGATTLKDVEFTGEPLRPA